MKESEITISIKWEALGIWKLIPNTQTGTVSQGAYEESVHLSAGQVPGVDMHFGSAKHSGSAVIGDWCCWHCQRLLAAGDHSNNMGWQYAASPSGWKNSENPHTVPNVKNIEATTVAQPCVKGHLPNPSQYIPQHVEVLSSLGGCNEW